MESSEIHNQQSHKTNIDFIHYGCSLIGLTLLPLAGTAAQIGMGLILLGLARIPTTFQSIKTLSRSPIVMLILAWWIIAYMSLAWSIDSKTSLLASPISILIIPALMPFLSKSKSYIYALAIGGGIHAVIQILIWFGTVKDVAYRPFNMNGGLHWYSPYTGLWAATILLLVLGLVANTGSWKNRTPLIIIALALTVSIVISGSRVLFLFIPLSLLVVLIRLITLPNVAVSRRVLAAIFISITVVSAGAVLIPDTFVNKRVKSLLLDQAKMTKDQNNNYETSLGLRYLWWKGGYKIWKRSPWIGHGGGSIMEQFALQETMMPSEFGANVTDFITPDPHSSFLATFIEQGILGASCMISFVLVSLISAWRKAVSDPATVGLVAAWSILVAIGLFHTIHLSAYAIPLVSVLTVLSIHSAPPFLNQVKNKYHA